MKRLYRKIYLTIVGSLLLVVLLSAAIWQLGGQRPPMSEALDLAGELVAAALPPSDAPAPHQAEAIAQLAARLGTDLTLYGPTLAVIASTGEPLRPPRGDAESGWSYGRGGPVWSLSLPDGRWLVARPPPHHLNPLVVLVLFLAAVAVAVGVSAYPVARGLTRRLERLQAGVETLGAGDLAARVRVEGRDEIARLAESFNRSAARIEELVGAHRMLLANASHELRTPLSRIRLGLDLMAEKPDPQIAGEIRRDIAELDRLIDEILLASRLDAAPSLNLEEVDLQALAAEECARYEDCQLDGDAAVIRGDPWLLRRLIRNLLENAAAHGRPPVRVVISRVEGATRITVTDAGPGVPEADRERVFAPFYRGAGEGKGAGLGLSLVRQIARLHGGNAEAIREDGAGRAGFTVTLADTPTTQSNT
jgi:signal transduction histidine kinase